MKWKLLLIHIITILMHSMYVLYGKYHSPTCYSCSINSMKTKKIFQSHMGNQILSLDSRLNYSEKEKKHCWIFYSTQTQITQDSEKYAPFPLRDIICLFLIFNAGHLYLTAFVRMYNMYVRAYMNGKKRRIEKKTTQNCSIL